MIGVVSTRDCGRVGTFATGAAIVTSVKSIQVHHTCRTHVISASDVVVGNGGQRVRGACGAGIGFGKSDERI